MKEILVPIHSASEAADAAARAIALFRAEPAAHVHLLNVQRPLPRHVSRFFPRGELREFHREAGMAMLNPAIRALDDAHVPHVDHVLVGEPARAIVEFAQAHGCGEIVLDEPAQGLMSILRAGSIGSQVRHLIATHAGDRAIPAAAGGGTEPA